MTTHERELTKPVDLCTPDGLTLNPDALGWSRVPLHRANLAGHFGINKKWDYWAVLTEDFTIAVTFADIDHLVLAEVYWADFRTKATGGKGTLLGAGGFVVPDISGAAPLEIDHDGLSAKIEDVDGATHFVARWTETDGRASSFDFVVENPANHESLNVVIPWDDVRFNFTSKQQARPARGVLRVGDEERHFGAEHGDAWGVLDVGRGRWPATITWNWGGGAGRAGDHVVGLQFGARWTEGSGFTENAIVVDGVLHKIGRELTWTYDWDNPTAPWRIVDPEGQLDLTLTPVFDKYTFTDVSPELGSEVHQVFGHYDGQVRTDDGQVIEFTGLLGFAEEARQRW